MEIKFMSKEDKAKLTITPKSNEELKRRVKRLESNIIATAKAYRQIGYVQVAKDIEVLIN